MSVLILIKTYSVNRRISNKKDLSKQVFFSEEPNGLDDIKISFAYAKLP